jgi:hypothetical protein
VGPKTHHRKNFSIVTKCFKVPRTWTIYICIYININIFNGWSCLFVVFYNVTKLRKRGVFPPPFLRTNLLVSGLFNDVILTTKFIQRRMVNDRMIMTCEEK